MTPAERDAYARRAVRATENARRARAQHKENAAAETALTMAQAYAMLPRIVRANGDTERRQAERRRAMQVSA